MHVSLLFLALFIPSVAALAEAPRLPSGDPQKPSPPQTDNPSQTSKPSESPLVRRARSLWEQNQLPDAPTIQKWLESPTVADIRPLPPSELPLPTREIARRAAASYIRVGWVFQCSKCSNWHTNLSGGYAIAPNAVATARHVLNKPDRMKENEGYAIAVRGHDEVLVIRGIVAGDSAADAAVLQVESNSLRALPLATEVEIGDPVFCLSEPNGERPYFSAGIVNRFAKNPDSKTNHPMDQRINVSTDWAPGSSGSAILDVQGNVVGHVGSISSIQGNPKGPEKPPHYMTIHWAIPAKSILRLLAGPNTSPPPPR